MSDDEPGIEFVDADDAQDGETDLLDTAPVGRRRGVLTAVAVLVAAVLVVVGVVTTRHASTDAHPADPTVTARPSAPAPPPIELPTTTPRPSVRQWEGVAGTAARSVCASCAVDDAPAGVETAARRALRTVSRFRAVVLDRHQALVVSVLLADGSELAAVLTPPSVIPDPTTFGVPPPLGVQSQRNRGDRLVVVIGGNVHAVGLLARPAVQRWLAALHR
ncbi:hypothetical protein [uncultured Jatrophihabitans sp.]|uniref:hypothetical protein n=1 Tax=uncultured Jatrophihabitans sp. TaxID=1610747 RepID=UPI0035CC30DF